MSQTLNFPLSTSPPQFQSPPSASGHRSAKSASVRCTAAVRDRPGTVTSSPTSLYEVLRVSRDASLTEIKAAYRNLAKRCHPDATDGSDGRDFIEIRQAYETLSDPRRKAAYDMSLGLGGRVGRLTSASFACDSVISSAAGLRRSGFYPTRNWETDQCW